MIIYLSLYLFNTIPLGSILKKSKHLEIGVKTNQGIGMLDGVKRIANQSAVFLLNLRYFLKLKNHMHLTIASLFGHLTFNKNRLAGCKFGYSVAGMAV